MRTRSLALILLLGCAAERTPAWQAQTPATPSKTPPTKGAAAAADDPFQKAVAEGDALFAERGDRDKLQKAILAWERATALKDDWRIWSKMSRAAYFMADGILGFETDTEEGKKKQEEHFQKGIAYGERAMGSYSPEFLKAVKADNKPEDHVKLINKDGVPAMYWFAVNLGKWAKAKGFATRLANKDKIKKIIDRCNELDPDYFYGAPPRFLGAYYAIAPAFAGGDLNKAYDFFNKSITKAPGYFATRVLLAEEWATRRPDKEAYKRELELVLNTREDVLPEVIPEQRIEKKKAEKALKLMEDRF